MWGNALIMGFGPQISDLMFWEYIAFRDAWNAANNPDGPAEDKVEAPPKDDFLTWMNSDG